MRSKRLPLAASLRGTDFPKRAAQPAGPRPPSARVACWGNRGCMGRGRSGCGPGVGRFEHDDRGFGAAECGVPVEVLVDLGPAGPQSLALEALCPTRAVAP